MGLLSLAIWTPIAFGLVLLAFGRDDQAQVTRWIALVGALVSFLITLPLYAQFDNASAAMQFVENLPWIERFNVNYHLGVDGISLWFVVLTAGFVGEWMVILAAVKANFWVGFASASALIFGAAYTLWMFKRVYLGPVANDKVAALEDIGAREFLVMAILAVAVLGMGIYPKPFTDVMDASVAALLQHVAVSKIAAVPLN